jgi:zinc/manganese transport system substrate-binding protein
MLRFVLAVAVAVSGVVSATGCGTSDSPSTSANPSTTSAVTSAAPATTTAGTASAASTTSAPSPTAASTTITPTPAQTIVVSTPVLASITRDIVGNAATVTVLMGNGVDPHDWSPSAKDIAAMGAARLVVVNGLDLEENLGDAIEQVNRKGVAVFRAAEHVTLRTLDEGAAHDHDHDHGDEAKDPHLWMDPTVMADVATALGSALESAGIPTAGRAATVAADLRNLDDRIRDRLATVPESRRKLVTGHESMGYFADRYRFRLIGAVVPSLSSQAEASAKDLATLKRLITNEKVGVIFTELGTPKATVDALAKDVGVRVVELGTHTMPADGSYITFLTALADAIAGALGTP